MKSAALLQLAMMMSETPIGEPIPYIIENTRVPDTGNRPPKIKGRIVEVRTEPKIGRNEPCPCDSGKKYKKCCINNKV